VSGLAVKDAHGKLRRVSSSAIWLLRSLCVQLSVAQVKHLSPEQKDAISSMQSPSEIPVKDFPIDRSIDIFIYVVFLNIYISLSLSIHPPSTPGDLEQFLEPSLSCLRRGGAYMLPWTDASKKEVWIYHTHSLYVQYLYWLYTYILHTCKHIKK
jgi:hypothetical protein